MFVACKETATVVSKLKFFFLLGFERNRFRENQNFCRIFDVKDFLVVRKGLAL